MALPMLVMVGLGVSDGDVAALCARLNPPSSTKYSLESFGVCSSDATLWLWTLIVQYTMHMAESQYWFFKTKSSVIIDHFTADSLFLEGKIARGGGGGRGGVISGAMNVAHAVESG